MTKITRSVVRIAAVALGWLAIGEPARAAVQWKAIGPWSETVEALALDPNNPKTVYAATPNGIFKSTDGAETWVRKSKGTEDIHALCVAIDPKTPATLYVGTYGDGLFKSTDGAETWKAVKPTGSGDLYALGRYRVKHVAVDPLNPKNLMFTSTHVYKSTTGGATATNVGLGSSTGVGSVTFDPKNPKVVYAAGGDLMKTTDFGATWSRLDFGVPSPAQARVVAVHPTSGEVLLGAQGLFKSTDAGSTWKAAGRGLQERARIFAIAWDPTDAGNVYVAASLKSSDEASVWHSTDGGATFQDVGKDLPYEKVSSLAMDPSNPRVLYAGTTFSGVFKTTDGGATWNEKSVGFESGFRTIRAVAAAGPGTLFATTFGAVYRTTDDGKTWRRLRAGLPKGVDYRFLAAGGAEKPAVIAGAEGSHLVRSTDGGETWETAPRSAHLRCVAPDPTNPRAFYFCAKDGAVFRGGDGSDWRSVSDAGGATFTALAIDPQNSQNVFAGTYGGLQRSTNGGKKWKEWKPFEKVKGSVVRPAQQRLIFAVAFDPKNPRTLYVATEEDGIFKSADGGETWSVVGLTGDKLTAFGIDPADPQRLVAGTREKGVLVSPDGGASWTDASAGLPEDERKKKEGINGIAFDAGSPARLYVATAGGGVYRAQ